MDQLDHEIVQDLLPLYHDNVCSERSRAAVEAHLKTCKDCRATLAAMDAPLPEERPTQPDDAAAGRRERSPPTTRRRWRRFPRNGKKPNGKPGSRALPSRRRFARCWRGGSGP